MTDIRVSLEDRVELLPGRLAFSLLSTSSATCETDTTPLGTRAPTVTHEHEEFVRVDGDLSYARFFADFGPLALGPTVRFCRGLRARLERQSSTVSSSIQRRCTVLYCNAHPHHRANATTLLAVFLVAVAGLAPEEAVRRLQSRREPPFGFRDASSGVCSFFLSALDCARAARRALDAAIWSLDGFSLENYDRLTRLEHGDMNWVVPGKLLAFSGPQRQRLLLDEATGATTLLAREYAAQFVAMGVTCVVRLNEPSSYDRKAFLHAGLRHRELHFPDGSAPSDDLLYKFLRTCERESGAVAVHCKAGLGRTGTLIAAFLIKNLRFSAKEAIAWCRICRPGSVVGPQQHFLLAQEARLHAMAGTETPQASAEMNDATPNAKDYIDHTKLQSNAQQPRQRTRSRG